MVPKMIQGPRMLTSYSLYRAGVSSRAAMGPQEVRVRFSKGKRHGGSDGEILHLVNLQVSVSPLSQSPPPCKAQPETEGNRSQAPAGK